MNLKLLAVLASIGLLIIFIIYLLLKRPRERYIKVESVFTPAELKFFKILIEILPEYTVLGKVRVADIIKVDSKKARGKYLKYFNKISRKHVDYLICDKETLTPIVAIELDDKTHEIKERMERDEFLEKAFSMASLPLIRFKVRQKYNREDIRNKITDVMQ